MVVIEPKVELWLQDDPIVHVAKCARVCYGSPTEGKSTARDLYDRLLKAKHNSMFRHESVYAIIPYSYEGKTHLDSITHILHLYSHCPYVQLKSDNNALYIATNRNFIIDSQQGDCGFMETVCNIFGVTPEHFANTEVGYSMMRYTFHITTQISTSRELNRVSPNNIAERSTRYCLEDGVIVRPHWINKDEFPLNDNTSLQARNYHNSCKLAFSQYKELIDLGMKRQDARGVLPLDTATEVVYTYSVDTWKHIIELRSSKRAHPNAAIIANMVKKELEELGYDF